MISYSKAIELEKRHHDKQAFCYKTKSETDFMWEIPSEILLFNKVDIKQGNKIVDMGCGPSTIVRNLIPGKLLKQIKYIGVDISSEMIKFAKINIPTGKFIIGDMSTIKLSKESANIIISLGALHHSFDKNKTLSHWSWILKSGGIILLREPTYLAFKLGEGESPMEEGIKVDELIHFTKKNGLILQSLNFFNSKAFHFFNRIMIKIGLGDWVKQRFLWYPVIYLDIFLCKYFSIFPFCKGLSFTAIIVKS